MATWVVARVGRGWPRRSAAWLAPHVLLAVGALIGGAAKLYGWPSP